MCAQYIFCHDTDYDICHELKHIFASFNVNVYNFQYEVRKIVSRKEYVFYPKAPLKK